MKQEETIDCLIGLPSGRVINVTKEEIRILLNLQYTDWDTSMDEFIFDDRVYKRINSFLNNIKIRDRVQIILPDNIYGNGKQGEVKDIVIYDGKRYVWGKDIGQIYNEGDKLYLIEFDNNKTGIYKREHLKKIREVDDTKFF